MRVEKQECILKGFARKGSVWGRLLCGQNVKYERGKCPIYSHVDKREKCVSVCHKMGNNIHLQTISSCTNNISSTYFIAFFV